MDGMPMMAKERKSRGEELISPAMDCLGVAVTIIDTQGTLLYYNQQAAKILDRKPAYLGADIHLHHQQTTTNQRLDAMLQEFSEGRTEPFHYQAAPYGQVILVTLTPIRKEGKFVGCVHCVRLKEENSPGK